MDKTMRLFVPQLATFGVEEKFNNRINTNYMAQHWAATGFKQKQKGVGQAYKKTLTKFGAASKHTGKLGEGLPPVPLHPIHNLLNLQGGGGHYYQQLPMNYRNKRSMMLYNQHLQAEDFFQLPTFGNERGVNMYHPTGNPCNRWMKRYSGDTTGSSRDKGQQDFHLTGQTPQALVGYETQSHNYPYAVGSFPTAKPSGGFNSNRLQNAINGNRNRYFQYQFANEIPDSMSNRLLHGIQGGQFNSMDPQQQYSVSGLYMNGNRRIPQSFKPQAAYDNTHTPLRQYSFDSVLPNIPGYNDKYHEFDMPDDLEGEKKSFRHKYNTRGNNKHNTIDLIGKYAKYYRTQDLQRQYRGGAAPNNKNNELVSRYLKHAAKKQVRSTSINVPKYTGDYDPDVFVTGIVQSQEDIPQSLSRRNTKQLSQEEINKESLLNKQEAAAEQKFRLEKSNFPAPTSLDSTESKAKYTLKYTKRKKLVIPSTSDKENDPSMLVKGGDDVALGNDDEISEQIQEKKVEKEKPITKEKTETTPAKVTTVKKVIKKTRRPSVVPKSIPEKEAEKKVEVSNKQLEQTNKPKAVKTIDIKKQVKKVTIEKMRRVDVKKKEEENKAEMEENLNLQSIVEEEKWPPLENDSSHSSGSEDELQFANENDTAENTEREKVEKELNAILAPLRAQVPDHFRISPTMGFLPIMPVTFSWFPMSQQHKKAFQKMSEQSKFPNSLRPFQRFAAT